MKRRENQTVEVSEKPANFVLCTMGSDSEDNQSRPGRFGVAQQKIPDLATGSAGAVMLDRP